MRIRNPPDLTPRHFNIQPFPQDLNQPIIQKATIRRFLEPEITFILVKYAHKSPRLKPVLYNSPKNASIRKGVFQNGLRSSKYAQIEEIISWGFVSPGPQKRGATQLQQRLQDIPGIADKPGAYRLEYTCLPGSLELLGIR